MKDCTNENGYSIENEWSYPEMAKYDEWVTIDVRLIPIVKFGITDFGYIKSNDYMRILIYVNGKLVLLNIRCKKKKEVGARLYFLVPLLNFLSNFFRLLFPRNFPIIIGRTIRTISVVMFNVRDVVAFSS